MILHHQQSAFEQLCEIANAWFHIQPNTLPFHPRGATLITGPTGTGKSFLSSNLAHTMEADYLSITSGEWVLLGCSARGAIPTWVTIFRFLQKGRKKGRLILCIEEIDKAFGHTSWEVFLRTEVFRAIDGDIPPGLCDGDGDVFSDTEVAQVKNTLQTRTLILGVGAFQDLHQERTRSRLGFHQACPASAEWQLTDMAKVLPPELTNRFRSAIVALPPLQRSDYEMMIRDATAQIPVYLQQTFIRLAHQKLETAIGNQLGCRFLEEILLDTIMAERRMARSPAHSTDNARNLNI